MRTTPAGAAQKFTPPRCVVSKETEAYHTQGSKLNARRHKSRDIPRPLRTPDRSCSKDASVNLKSMKVALGIAVLLLIAFSLVADYKWKQWMATRKQDRDAHDRRS
jgi:hypothetical protein